jgi:hypothetical protein
MVAGAGDLRGGLGREGKETIGGGGFPSLFVRLIFVLFSCHFSPSVWGISLRFEPSRRKLWWDRGSTTVGAAAGGGCVRPRARGNGKLAASLATGGPGCIQRQLTVCPVARHGTAARPTGLTGPSEYLGGFFSLSC